MFNFFKKENISKEQKLTNDILTIKQDSNFIDNLKKILQKDGYTNIQVSYGEPIDSKGQKTEDICVDIWFYNNKQMYMLTIYTDKIILLKEVLLSEQTENEDYDYDLVDVLKFKTKKGVLSTLKVA